MLLWAKRTWRCPDRDCPRTTFSEDHALAGPRAKLTTRAAGRARDALQHVDISVSALAHQRGVSWHTIWDAMRAEATRRLSAAGRLTGVNALGVDEHVWSHTAAPGTGMVTVLDPVPGRTGKAYADWPKERGVEFTAGIKTAALVPFRGYANAIRDELPEAITVLDAFHVVKLGSAMVDEIRPRVQQDRLGHRGRKGDPLDGIYRTLQFGAEHLTKKQTARLDANLTLRDPDQEVIAWQCYQKLRNIYHSKPERGRDLVTEVIASFPSCPIPEVSRLRRTLKQWKVAILASFDTFGASNGTTEPPAESPAASATSPTAGSDAHSPSAATTPTESNRPTMPNAKSRQREVSADNAPFISVFPERE